MVNNTPEELDVLVVGAGFSGLYQLYQLRKLGYKVKAVDSEAALGGVWRTITYPGARVDSEVPVYQYSKEEIWKGWNYSQRYPDRAEILKFFEHMDKTLDLSKDIYFNTWVVSAEFDGNTNKWHVKTEGGQVYIAKFLNLCVGLSTKTYEPQFKGINDYKGFIHHSSKWPNQVDLHGKRVAVIGTGASGVQIIQEIGPMVGHLTVFQRTPNTALPMLNTKLTEEQQVLDKKEYPALFKKRLECFGGFPYASTSTNTLDDTPEAREAVFEKIWAQKGFSFWLAGYGDLFINEQANNEAYAFWCKKVRARIHDPVMQDKLAPLKPLYAFGTKRPSLETNYYEVFNQPNVNLIDLRANPIDCFTPAGIRTKDGVEHEFDAVVLATGYDMITGAVNQIDIKGLGSASMKEKWAKGVRTYLGMAVAEFPNLVLVYNAQSPVSFTNGPTLIEAQGDWVVRFLDNMLKSGKARIDASLEAEEKWANKVGELFGMTLFDKTDSWYNGSNIPGKKREGMSYCGGIPAYFEECKKVEDNGYAGFVIS